MKIYRYQEGESRASKVTAPAVDSIVRRRVPVPKHDAGVLPFAHTRDKKGNFVSGKMKPANLFFAERVDSRPRGRLEPVDFHQAIHTSMRTMGVSRNEQGCYKPRKCPMHAKVCSKFSYFVKYDEYQTYTFRWASKFVARVCCRWSIVSFHVH